jgi:hypothetical protein
VVGLETCEACLGPVSFSLQPPISAISTHCLPATLTRRHHCHCVSSAVCPCRLLAPYPIPPLDAGRRELVGSYRVTHNGQTFYFVNRVDVVVVFVCVGIAFLSLWPPRKTVQWIFPVLLSVCTSLRLAIVGINKHNGSGGSTRCIARDENPNNRESVNDSRSFARS